MGQVDVVRVIDEARGFLNALRELCIPPAIAWIGIQAMPDGRDRAIDLWIQADQERTYGPRTAIEGLSVRRFLRTHLFSRITATDEQKTKLERRFREYIDLAADADSGEVHFERLSTNESILIEIECSDFELHGAIVFSLTNYIVVLALGTNNKPERG